MSKLTEQDYERAAKLIGCDVPTIKAVVAVESNGAGFNPDGSLKILFEGHIFHDQTCGRFDKSHPTLSYARWTKIHYYGGEKEYKRFNQAIALHREAALLSTSFGLFQIMGFNFGLCGFKNVESFYLNQCQNEGTHLDAFLSYVITRKLDDELRDRRWAAFASAYNGPGYARNQYDAKLASAYKRFTKPNPK